MVHGVTEEALHTEAPITDLEVVAEDSQGERSHGVLTSKAAARGDLAKDVVELNWDLGNVEGHIDVAFKRLVRRIGMDGDREMTVASSQMAEMKRKASIDVTATLRKDVGDSNGVDITVSMNGTGTRTDTVVIPKHITSNHKEIAIAMMKDVMGNNKDSLVTARRDGTNRRAEKTTESTNRIDFLSRRTTESTSITDFLIRGIVTLINRIGFPTRGTTDSNGTGSPIKGTSVLKNGQDNRIGMIITRTNGEVDRTEGMIVAEGGEDGRTEGMTVAPEDGTDNP